MFQYTIYQSINFEDTNDLGTRTDFNDMNGEHIFDSRMMHTKGSSWQVKD